MIRRLEAHHLRRLIWLVATVLATSAVLATADVAQSAPPREPPAAGEHRGRIGLADPIVIGEREQIPLFINPGRQVISPGDEVLVSVGDPWRRADLSWSATWADDSDSEAGSFSSYSGAFVRYTAPDWPGDVKIVVYGEIGYRSGTGVAKLFVR